MKGSVLWTNLFSKSAGGAASGMTKLGGKISEFLSKNIWGLMAAGAAIVIKELINLWGETSKLDEALDLANEKVRESAAELQILSGRLEITRQGTDDYNSAIDELNRKLESIGATTLDYAASNEDVAAALKLVREETERQIRLEVYRDKLKEIIAAQIAYKDSLDEMTKAGGRNDTVMKVAKKGYEDATFQLNELQKRIDGLIVTQNNSTKATKDMGYEWGNISEWNMGGEISKVDEEITKITPKVKDLTFSIDDFNRKSKETNLILRDLKTIIAETFGVDILDEELKMLAEQYITTGSVIKTETEAILQDMQDMMDSVSFADETMNAADEVTADTEDAVMEERKKKWDELVKKVNQYGDSAISVLNSIGQFEEAKMNKELALWEGNEEEKERIRKKYAEKQKKIAIAQALINGALAITNIWATTPKVDFGASTIALIIASGISTLASVATIASQKMSGGGILKGRSHAGGGIDIGNNIEAEGGEGIINKRSTAMFKPLLSAINSYNGFGKSFKAARGMLPAPSLKSRINATILGGIDIDRLAQLIIDGINDKQVIVTEKDISEKLNMVNKIETKVRY